MLQTQVNYWANQEQKRHNQAQEKLTRRQQNIDQQQADTAKMRAETENINALTAQTNAATQQAKVAQDYELGLLNLDVATQNAQTARIQANAESAYKGASTEKVRTETEFIPYQAGTTIVSNVVGAAKGLSKPIKDTAKGIKGLFQRAVYNLRN